MRKGIIAVWFSCGAASAVAAKKTIEMFGETNEVIILNTPVAEEPEDNRRFLKDVEKWLGQEIIEVRNSGLKSDSAVDIWESKKYMSGIKGAPCTQLLKKQARYEFESNNKILWHVLGFTADELDRHYEFVFKERNNVLPILICNGITKSQCFSIIEDAGIRLPDSYYNGFPNANCIGCVKATSPTYWNHVRKIYPEIFKQRAEQSRRIGARLVRHKGKRIFLDELPVDAVGQKMKSYECGLFCYKD